MGNKTAETNREMPRGLPGCLASGKEGFDRLCDLLGIESRRATRQDFAKQKPISGKLKEHGLTPPSRLKTAARVQWSISTFYDLPDVRRELWRVHKELNFPEQHDLMPSLEVHVIRHYDPALFEAGINEEALADCHDFFNPSAKTVDWQRPALAALPRIRHDLLNWNALDPERQRTVTLAAFATASIFNDIRLLVWASEENETLADEFRFALGGTPDRVSAEEAGGKEVADEHGHRPVEGGSEELMAALGEACQAVADLALQLGSDPSDAQLFDELARRAGEVERLRGPVQAAFETTRIENLLDNAAASIRSHTTGVPPLARLIPDLCALWKLVYLADHRAGVATLREDTERVGRDLADAVGNWRTVSEDTATLERNLSEAEDIRKKDPFNVGASERVEELHRQLARSKSVETEALRTVLLVASPTGHEYEPGRDYEREWAETGIKPIPAAPEPDDEPDNVPSAAEAKGVADQGPNDINADATHVEPPRPALSTSGKEEDFAGSIPTPLPSSPPINEPSTDDGTRNAVEQVDDPDETTVHAAVPKSPARSGWDDTLLDPRTAAVWRAIGDDRLGIAYHIAKLIPQHDSDDPAFPPADLIAAAALGDSVHSAEGEIVQTLAEHLEAAASLDLGRDDSEIDDVLNLLLFSGTLLPTLFAPPTGALSALRQIRLSNALSPLYDFSQAVAHHAERLLGVRLDVFRLRLALNHTIWESHFEKHRADVRDWRLNATAQTVLFRPAQLVWKHWLGKGGILSNLVDILTETDDTNRERTGHILAQFEEPQKFKDLVHNTDRHGVGRNTGRDIEARALVQLKNHVAPALDLARHWLRLMDVRSPEKRFVEEAVDKLRGDVQLLQGPAVAALEQAQERSSPMTFAAGIARARSSIESFTTLFTGDESDIVSAEDQVPAAILGRDLLYVTGLAIDTDYRLTDGQDPESSLSLLMDTGAHATSLESAFDGRLQRGDLIGAQMVCDRMRAVGDPAEDRCRKDLEVTLSEKHVMLEENRYRIEDEIEQAFVLGEITDERDRLAAQITPATSSIDATTVGRATKDLEDVRIYLDQLRRESVTELKAEWQNVHQSATSEDRELVEKALAERDVASAREYIQRLKEGQSLIEDGPQTDPFADFLSVAHAIEESLSGSERPTHHMLVQAAEQGGTVACTDFSILSPQASEQAGRALNLWYEMERSEQIDADRLNEFLTLLGFVVRDLVVTDTTTASLEVDPLQNRQICPLHEFGSAANGQYTLVLNWRSPARESLIQSVGKYRNRRTLVFHFGTLGPDRAWLRSWAIQEQALFLVLDETLLLYLFSRESERLRTLFHCALPYTAANPFVTTSSLVPPELFYGRSVERGQVMNQYGPCFVYGGRQLGKTALLRSAEAEFNSPEQPQLAKWIDLKVRGIGDDLQPKDIWGAILWDELRDIGVIPDDRARPQGEQKLIDALLDSVKRWLDEHDNGRLLLLLDEADAFLELDGLADFRESSRLKGLMDDTERRFKVVFSGLHNVLRTTERANHPLAHLGEPVCVGPLLRNGEWHEARNLLRVPLSAVGSRFHHDHLITHILAQTNYYPSLIQLCGAEFVRYLRDSKRPFPYEIGPDDIRAVLRRDGLRQSIREKFRLTLQLDPRYEVIAYAIALKLKGADADLASGLDSRTIAQEVRDWWHLGFDISDVELDMLLQELEGLGVLRHATEEATGYRRYAFRNPNVVSLLGTAAEIEQVLYKERQLPKLFEASSYRARYRTDPDSPRRGPLTYEQEALLRKSGGVTIIYGSEAANVDKISEFLRGRIETELYTEIDGCMTEGDLARRLTRFRPVIRRGTHVYLVAHETPWALRWVDRAARAWNRLERRRYVRLVFLANPTTLWNTLVDTEANGNINHPALNGLQEGAPVDWIGVGPWNDTFLRRWCDDNNLPLEQDSLKRLMGISGGWPVVLENLDQSKDLNTQQREESLETFVREDTAQLLDSWAVVGSALREIHKLVEYEAYTTEDVRVLAEQLPADEHFDFAVLNRRLTWAKLLGLLSETAGNWKVNPLLRQILTEGPSR